MKHIHKKTCPCGNPISSKEITEAEYNAIVDDCDNPSTWEDQNTIYVETHGTCKECLDSLND